MRRTLFAAVLAAALMVLGVSATGASSGTAKSHEGAKSVIDDIPGPLAAKERALREKAIQLRATGAVASSGSVVQLGGKDRGQFVQLGREGEDSIWTIAVEFGNTQATHNHGALGNINHGGTPGPVHNQIPQPDRSVDNTTIWAPDFSQSYYTNLLFSETPGKSSMRNFYIEASSGRYTVNGTVENWVKVPFNEAAYGSNYCGSIVCVRDIQRLLEDGTAAWYSGQVAAGKTPTQINMYLSQFDKWDRYDYDGDGNFNEPDGYIDHFQTIHAGAGEETGGGAEGTDAIWSHRSYINTAGLGVQGPAFNPLGGIKVGGSNYWVGDYTVEPENGGVGVFAHEFGHDLGLPDEYDTSGNTGGAENSTGFWTNWSQGSYGSDGTPQDGIGNRPIAMTAWERWFLGWLNYRTVNPGQFGPVRVELGPTAFNSNSPQAVVVNLPDKVVAKNVGTPFAGSKFYYSSSGDNLDVLMYRPVSLPAGASLSAKTRYNSEQDWDYGYLVVSTNGGASWTPVHTNLSTNTSPNGQNFGEGITGVSAGSTWTTLTADLSAWGGQNVLLGFRYWTDGAAQGNGGSVAPGFAYDDIAISGQSTDGAETNAGWTFDPASGGFHVTTGTDTVSYYNAYFIENRQYLGPDQLPVGFDLGLYTAPYNFGGTVGPKWTERYSYQNGVLVWYYNSQYSDNNVGDHPGEGEILPIDAHPNIMHWANGTNVRPRIQAYDSAFGLQGTPPLTLSLAGVPMSWPSLAGNPMFDDSQSYYRASDPADGGSFYKAGWASVKIPNSGTKMQVLTYPSRDGHVRIIVTPPR